MFVRSDVSFLLHESFAIWKEFNCYHKYLVQASLTLCVYNTIQMLCDIVLINATIYHSGFFTGTERRSTVR